LKEDGEEASNGELKENEGEEAMELDPASMRRLKEDGLNFPFFTRRAAPSISYLSRDWTSGTPCQ
jgi:hypothetical protein